jgi:hypothetical protein
MPTDGKRTLKGDEIIQALGLMPPLAEDFGVQVASLGSEERVSLSNSIARAVAYQRYLRTLENEDPDPNEPVPPQVPPKAA